MNYLITGIVCAFLGANVALYLWTPESKPYVSPYADGPLKSWALKTVEQSIESDDERGTYDYCTEVDTEHETDKNLINACAIVLNTGGWGE